MAGSLQPYKELLLVELAILQPALAKANATLHDLALLRVTTQLMLNQITKDPNSTLRYDVLGPDKFGFSGPERWFNDFTRVAAGIITPQFSSVEELGKKFEQYLRLSEEMIHWGSIDPQVIKTPGRNYLILGPNPLVPKIMQAIASELLRWFTEHPNDVDLFTFTPRQGLGQLLTERPDLAALLRIAQTLPLDVEARDVPIETHPMQLVVELAVSFIPVVGSMVAAYEVLSGRDLFGNELGDLERGVIGASVLLPLVGRLASVEGRAIYTEARLVQLYGREAAVWNRAIAVSGLTNAERQALATVERAEQALVTETRLTGTLARESAAAVPVLANGGTAISRQVDRAVADLLRDLSRTHPELLSLDAFAIERILAKGPNVDHIKGQLLEELVESRIVPWLRTREGAFALGVEVPAGKRLEFLPGHMIRDAAGRQISDGMLGYRRQTDFVILAVFEAKSGRSAARELSFARSSLGSLTEGQRAELRAMATDVLAEQRAAAAVAGRPFKKSIEDVEKEVMLSEAGGQVRRDIERLAPNVGATTTPIRFGAETLQVRFSPTKTKFFGITPKDVRLDTIESQLIQEKVLYELLGVDMKAADLKRAAAALLPHATPRVTPTPTPAPIPTPTP
jgi:hypothetical protein